MTKLNVLLPIFWNCPWQSSSCSEICKQTSFYLPDSIFFQSITGDWSAADEEDEFIERDMILIPDYTTATAAPWTAASDWTLQVIHDAYDRKGNPIPYAPRNVLKKIVNLFHEMGLKPIVAPEMEFFLVGRNVDPSRPIEAMIGRSGRPAAARQAYSMTAIDEFGAVIDDIYDFAEAQGFEIDGITHEGAGQLEINLRHGDPVKLADEVFYFKRLIREAALRHNCFEPSWRNPLKTNRVAPCISTIRSLTWKPERTRFPALRVGKPNYSLTLSVGFKNIFPLRLLCWRLM